MTKEVLNSNTMIRTKKAQGFELGAVSFMVFIALKVTKKILWQ